MAKSFKLFKENRLDQAYTLTVPELKTKFLAYLQKRGLDWVRYYYSRAIIDFITSTEGLNSTIDTRQIIPIEEALEETLGLWYYGATNKQSK